MFAVFIFFAFAVAGWAALKSQEKSVPVAVFAESDFWAAQAVEANGGVV